jgi:hypothetical protein
LLIVIAGWVSAVLVFSSFFMKTMVPLRMVAICSNVAFITYALLGLKYGVFGRVYPIFVLHAALLPLNVIRLRQLKGLLRAVQEANADETLRSLCPYMVTETARRGRRPVQEGRLGRPAVRHRPRPRAVPGDRQGGVGRPGVRRGRRVRRRERAHPVRRMRGGLRMHTITRDKALELYYENPRFGLFLIRLVAGLVVENQGLAGATLTRSG